MDLDAVAKLTGRNGKVAKMCALLCFILAGGLLLAGHAGPSRSSLDPTIQFAAR